MGERQIRCLPVVENDRLIGIVSLGGPGGEKRSRRFGPEKRSTTYPKASKSTFSGHYASVWTVRRWDTRPRFTVRRRRFSWKTPGIPAQFRRWNTVAVGLQPGAAGMSGSWLVESQTQNFASRRREPMARCSSRTAPRCGATLGWAASRVTHAGPERIKEVLNAEPGFFSVRSAGRGRRRADDSSQPRACGVRRAGRQSRSDARSRLRRITSRRAVAMLLSNGTHLRGVVSEKRLQGPRSGLQRLRARSSEQFLHLETPDATYLVNVRHLI